MIGKALRHMGIEGTTKFSCITVGKIWYLDDLAKAGVYKFSGG